MSDEAYALVMALTCIAYAIVLIIRFRQARIMKRLIRSLEASAKEKPPADPTETNEDR